MLVAFSCGLEQMGMATGMEQRVEANMEAGVGRESVFYFLKK